MAKPKQCKGKTKGGKRCRRNVFGQTEYCYQHESDAKQEKTSEAKENPVTLMGEDVLMHNGQDTFPPRTRQHVREDVMWDVIKIGAVTLATYLTYRVLKGILKRM
ncbi:MAG: hypothetical protein HKN76_20340 [Saprospiraceae bacterium]|nr:hypothetical protein [Saprospiraceae bacterium]